MRFYMVVLVAGAARAAWWCCLFGVLLAWNSMVFIHRQSSSRIINHHQSWSSIIIHHQLLSINQASSIIISHGQPSSFTINYYHLSSSRTQRQTASDRQHGGNHQTQATVNTARTAVRATLTLFDRKLKNIKNQCICTWWCRLLVLLVLLGGAACLVFF